MTRDILNSELSPEARALKYENESQQRVLKVLLALSGHEVTGLAAGEISKELQVSPANVTRDLANLQLAGLAEEIVWTPGRWRLTPKLVQIGVAMLADVEQQEKKLGELKSRYTREPR
jgi:DNA-binding IclR family transcriptional regulator